MTRHPVKSSNVKSIGHDGKSTLEVEFTHGGIYQYTKVPLSKYNRLITAKSIGAHMNEHIIPKHKGKKV
jgi:hypothetical protein